MLSELNTIQGGTASPYLSSSLPFCLRFNMTFRGGAPYSHAAKLDTGLVTSDYPGGIPSRSSSNHFQFARPMFCSALPQSVSFAHVRLYSILCLLEAEAVLFHMELDGFKFSADVGQRLNRVG